VTCTVVESTIIVSVVSIVPVVLYFVEVSDTEIVSDENEAPVVGTTVNVSGCTVIIDPLVLCCITVVESVKIDVGIVSRASVV
jgi:hypothetical protein